METACYFLSSIFPAPAGTNREKVNNESGHRFGGLTVLGASFKNQIDTFV